jgi:hypothetical protein
MGLTLRGKLAEVVRAELGSGRTATLVSEQFTRRHALLLNQIVSEGNGRTKQFPTSRRTVLRHRLCGGDEQVGFSEQVLERLNRSAVGWHTFIVKPGRAESKRSLFSVQRTFQTLPRR